MKTKNGAMWWLHFSFGIARGIITSGHAYKIGDNVFLDNILIGKCTKSQVFGAVDVAFCEVTNSSYIPSNVIEFTSFTLSTLTLEAAYNSQVTLVGALSGIKSGRVTSSSTSQTFRLSSSQSIRLYDIVEAEYSSTSGDSGGLIFLSDANGVRYTTGVHVGQVNNKRYYSKATNIMSAFSVYRY